MNAREALKSLESMGTAQTRKTYGRHGVSGKMYGVKFGDMQKLVRKIKSDHELAAELWNSGNHDARVMATMIADPDRLTKAELSKWIRDVDNHVLSYSLAGLARRGEAGRKLMPRWLGASGEWPAATGWMMLAGMAREPGALTASESRKHLAAIEKRIHGSKNRVKYSMNTALIAMGSFVPDLEEEAIQVASRIGQVEVDHGLTSCETPLAVPYIRKAAAHHRTMLAKKAAKKATKRSPGSPATKAAGKTAKNAVRAPSGGARIARKKAPV